MSSSAAVNFIRSVADRHGLPVQDQVVLVPRSQAALAIEAGLSRGTVAKYFRQLGPAVQAGPDGLVVDLSAVSPPVAAAVVPVAAALSALRLAVADDQEWAALLGDHLEELRAISGAQGAQMRAISGAQPRAISGAQGAHRRAISGAPGAPPPRGAIGEPADDVGGLADLVGTFAGEGYLRGARPCAPLGQLASSSSVSKERELASCRQGAPPATSSPSDDAAIDAALIGLVAYCRRCSPPLPTALNGEGRRQLSRYSPAELAAGGAEILARLKAGRPITSPLGLLVSMARKGDEAFFAVPEVPPAPAPAEQCDEVEVALLDPESAPRLVSAARAQLLGGRQEEVESL